jgi:integrase
LIAEAAKPMNDSNTRLGRSISLYLRRLEDEDLSEKYIKEQARQLKHFRQRCREHGIHAPSRISLELVRDHLLRLDGMSITYQKQTIVALRSFLRFCNHPASINLKVKMSGTARTRIHWISQDQVRQIFASPMRPQVAVMIYLGLLMGLRMCEILRVRWDEANDALTSSVLQVHGKGYKARPVPLHPDVREVLMQYMRLNPPRKDPELLLGFKKSRAEDLLARFAKNNGLDHFSFHDMRRTCATAWFDAKDEHGVRLLELETISEILGHADPRTTKNYIGVNLRHMAAAMSAYRVPQPSAAMNLSSR